MRVHIINLGCARNLVDGEMMSGILRQNRCTMVDTPLQADAIVVNTCSFIQSAADESIDVILEMARYKAEGDCKRLVVTGCLPERYREDIVGALPEVDVFLGTGAYDQILEAVRTVPPGTCRLPPAGWNPLWRSMPFRTPSVPHLAYLKIAEGCNRRCTYCIIPKLRGDLRSRPLPDIISEARFLIESGAKELVLVAQDAACYGRDLSAGVSLAGLLDAIAALSADIWIRVLYGHPESLDAAAVGAIARHPNVCSYFDLPIQHASDPVLKRMGRPGSQRDLRGLFDMIRSTVPDATLRTTVMTGFPGETEEDFQTLLNFISEIRFDHLGAFVYSDSEDLPAHRLSQPVSRKAANKRYRALMTRQMQIASEINAAHIGQTRTVLVEEMPEPGLYAGRTVFQAPEVDGITYVRANNLAIGEFASVRIIDALEYDLIGECI